MMQVLKRAAILPLMAMVAVACTDSSGSNGGTGPENGTATLRVQITDAPSVDFDSAIVYIGAVTVFAEDGTQTEVTDAGGVFDLLQLQNGVTAEIGETELQSGTYTELRMIVDSARVVLADGFEFEDGTITRSLKVPSGSSSGIKIKLFREDGDSLVRGVEIVEGETVLVIDFDVYRNFKVQGNPNTPAGLKGVIFTPTLRAVARDVAGSIAGTVTSSDDGSPLAGLTVMATLQGTDGDPVEATATTADDGTYVIRFLTPGTYEVQVMDFSADAQQVDVGQNQDVTGVNFTGTST